MADENKHTPGTAGATAAVFITPEQRAQGLDPAAVAAELARQTAATTQQMGGRGVSVQMLPGAAPPLPNVVNSTPAADAPPVRANTPLLQAPPGGVQSWGAPGVVAVARTHPQPPLLPVAPAPAAVPLAFSGELAPLPSLLAAAALPAPEMPPTRIGAPLASTLAQLFGLPLEPDGSLLVPAAVAARIAAAFPQLGLPPAPAPTKPVPPEATAVAGALGVDHEALTPPDMPEALAPVVSDTRGAFGSPAGAPLLIELRGPVTIVSPGRLRVMLAEDPESGASEVTIEPGASHDPDES